MHYSLIPYEPYVTITTTILGMHHHQSTTFTRHNHHYTKSITSSEQPVTIRHLYVTIRHRLPYKRTHCYNHHFNHYNTVKSPQLNRPQVTTTTIIITSLRHNYRFVHLHPLPSMTVCLLHTRGPQPTSVTWFMYLLSLYMGIDPSCTVLVSMDWVHGKVLTDSACWC